MRRMFGPSRMGLAGVVLAMALLTMGAGSASATFVQQGKKLHGSGADKSFFGESVALSGDGNTMLVGSPLDNVNGTAWVFTRSEGKWTHQTTLSPNNVLRTANTAFGQSVA